MAAFGCTLGIVPHVLAAVTGLAALLHTSAVLFQSVKYAGVALPALHGLDDAEGTRDPLGPRSDDPPALRSGKVIMSAILVNLLNPKLSIFFFAFLPQFVAPASGEPRSCRCSNYPASSWPMTFVVFVLYGLFAAVGPGPHPVPAARARLDAEAPSRSAFVGLGVKLALREQ